jgi:magnesium chelatase family protein
MWLAGRPRGKGCKRLPYPLKLRPARGVLAIVLEAKKRGRQILIVPKLNAEQAAHVQGLAAYGANSLTEVVNFLRGESPLGNPVSFPAKLMMISLRFTVSNMSNAVAAAAAHNLLMIGPIFDAKRKRRLCSPPRKSRRWMKPLLGISGFYCDSGLQVRNRASAPSKTRYRNTIARCESSGAIF